MFTTEDGVNVTERISDGRTKVFDTEAQAKKYAKITRSYSYQLYKQVKNEKRTLVGFAVPK